VLMRCAAIRKEKREQQQPYMHVYAQLKRTTENGEVKLSVGQRMKNRRRLCLQSGFDNDDTRHTCGLLGDMISLVMAT